MFNHLYLYNPDNGVRCDSPTIQAAVDQFGDISGFKVVGKDKSLEANMQVALQKVKMGRPSASLTNSDWFGTGLKVGGAGSSRTHITSQT